MRNTHKLAALAATVLLGMGAAAYAHNEGGMKGGPRGGEHGCNMMGEMGSGMMHGGMGPGGMMQGGRGPGAMPAPGARMEAHLAKVKTELKLRPDQEAAWSTVKNAMSAQMAKMQEMHDAAPPAATLPERMDQHLATMQGRMGQMQSMRDAVKTFYAQLTPEQKLVADKSMPMGKHGRHMAQ